MLDIAFFILVLAAGIALMLFSSGKVVDYAQKFAVVFDFPPMIVGLVIVAFGTDLPEIANSLLSSAIGHGDINVGNGLGSCVVQITLVLGLIPFLAKKDILLSRKNTLLMGGAAVIAVLAAILALFGNEISRGNALALILMYPVLMIISDIGYNYPKIPEPKAAKGRWWLYLALLILGLAGIGLGAYLTIDAIIGLSAVLGVNEYIVSFFIAAIGTSLPELVVNIAAVRQKHYGIAIGNIIGSNIIDATFAIGIGPLFFPITFSSEIAGLTAWYLLIATVVIVGLAAWKRKVDRQVGAVCLAFYLLSFAILAYKLTL